MSEATDIKPPTNEGGFTATCGSGLARPYCAYCDGYHDDALSCEEKLSTVLPKAERLTVDDLWTAIPTTNRCKVSFAMLQDTVKRLNRMGVRIVRACREEGAPEQEAIGGVHIRGFAKMPKSTQDAMVVMCEKAFEMMEQGHDFTTEEVEGYFEDAKKPNPAVDEILAHTPATWDELRARQNDEMTSTHH